MVFGCFGTNIGEVNASILLKFGTTLEVFAMIKFLITALVLGFDFIDMCHTILKAILSNMLHIVFDVFISSFFMF